MRMRMHAAWVTLVLAGTAWAQQVKDEKKPAPVAVPQEDPKAKALREAYESEIRRERREVTLKFKNAKVEEVVQAFREQGGINVVLDRRNFPEDFRIDEFEVTNEPFRKALEAFTAKAELAIEDVSLTLIRLSRPTRVNFNFRDANIKDVIDMIARVSGANIIISDDVKGKINLSITNVPWNAVLDYVVKTLGFTTVKEEFGVIRVINPLELLKQMETKVFTLKYVQPPSLYQAKIEEGKFLSGKPVIAPTQMQELLDRFTLRKVLETVLSKDASGKLVGSLNFDPGTNAFFIKDTKLVLDKVGEIIAMLDVEPEQVLVDLKFISTTNEDLLSFGMNYSFGSNDGAYVSSGMRGPGTLATPKITQLPFGLGHEPGTGDQTFLTDYDFRMTFRAFKLDKFTRLIQEPTIAALDNTEATIFVGESISYAESTVTQTAQGGLASTLGEGRRSPVKVGFQLFVIPKIVSESNKVILTIIPTNEFLSGGSGGSPIPGFDRFTIGSGVTAQSIDLPRISQSSLVTKLIIESGRTAVLGGLVIERTTYEDKGLPILKDIPIVSYLFKQRNDVFKREHLLIFLTPRIIPRGSGSSENLQRLLKMREDEERRAYEDSKKAPK